MWEGCVWEGGVCGRRVCVGRGYVRRGCVWEGGYVWEEGVWEEGVCGREGVYGKRVCVGRGYASYCVHIHGFMNYYKLKHDRTLIHHNDITLKGQSLTFVW